MAANDWPDLASAAAAVAEFGANATAQSTVVLAAGLAAARLARGRGAAVQSAVLRATLVATLACPAASWLLGAAGVRGPRVGLPPARVVEVVETKPVEPGRPALPDANPAALAVPVPPPAGDLSALDTAAFADRRASAGGSDDWGTDAGPRSARRPLSPRVSRHPELLSASTDSPPFATRPPAPDPSPSAPPVVQRDRTTAAGTLYVGLAALWATGTVALLGRLVLAYLILAAARHRGRPAPAEMVAACAAAARTVGVRPPPVLVTPRVTSPCLFGRRRPVILLPATPDDDTSAHAVAPDGDTAGPGVFLHELAHLRRGDCAWHLAARLACAALWFQPLLWALARRSERAADDVCDDHVVALGGDRPAYARALVDLAERLQSAGRRRPAWPACQAGVGVLPFRSAVGQRVARVLDATRAPSTRAGRAAAAALLVAGLAATLAAGVLGAGRGGDAEPAKPERSIAGDLVGAPAIVAAVPASAPATAPSAPVADRAPADKPDPAGDEVAVRGVVLDPAGKPLAGAAVTVAANWGWDDPAVPTGPLARTASGPDGRFALAFRKSQASPFTVQNGSPGADVWRGAVVAARADGLGVAWARWDAVDAAGDLVLRLVEDLPVEGRVVDLEGRPVAGATVVPGGVSSQVALGVAEGVKARRDAVSLRHPLAATGLAAGVTTDAEGRFRLVGLGRERTIYSLEVVSDRGVTPPVTVVTRVMPTFTESLGANPKFKDVRTTYGAKPELVLSPARSVVGTVRDGKTRRPIAGVTVGGNLNWRWGKGSSVTNEEGRYRLDGLKKAENTLLVTPLDGQPYLTRELKVADEPGLGPITADVDLSPGVWITGRVTDKATGRPVPARVQYTPFRDNPFADAVPDYAALRNIGSAFLVQGQTVTKADGTYRTVGIPGRGLVAVTNFDAGYRKGVGAERIKGVERPGLFGGMNLFVEIPLDRYSAVAEINVPADAAEGRADLQLDPGGSVRVAVEDPDGRPIVGAQAFGFRPWDRGPKLEGATGEAAGFGPDERRAVVVLHADRGLGRVAVLGPDDVRRGSATIRLMPMAVFTGRAVTADGDPINGAQIWADGVGPEAEKDDLHGMGGTLSDKDGRFTLRVPTGYRCTLGGSRDSGRGEYITLREPFEPTPGTTDLGDVRLVPRRMGAGGDSPPKPATKPSVPAAVPAATRPANAPVPAAQPATASAAIVPAAADDEVRVRGVVLDPAGKPLAGAAVTVAVNWWGDEPEVPPGPLARTTSGPDGRFAVTFRKSQASPFTMSRGQSGADVWRRAVVAARADGLGVAWARWDDVDAVGDVALRLVEDLPVEGRVVDLEGRPVAGATVVPASLSADVVLGMANRPNPRPGAVALMRPLAATGLPTAVTTDADGRFRIAGLGRERTASLRVTSPKGVLPPAKVATRLMEPFTEVPGANPAHADVWKVYGARPELVLAAARPVVGTVRDAKTRAPIAGATVTGNANRGWGEVRTVTDGQGRYRLDGMMKAANVVLVEPPDDRPYLTREVEVKDEPGLGPATADVDLTPGVWIAGRVTDRATKRPVPARVQYTPFRSNKYADATADYAALRNILSAELPQGRTTTKPDGTYRTVGLPGRGVVAVYNPDGRYRVGVGAERIRDMTGPDGQSNLFVLLTPGFSSAMVAVDVPAGAAEARTDFELDAGGTVRVALRDADGRPVAGTRVSGLGLQAPDADAGGVVELAGFGPDERRAVVAVHPDRGLGVVAVLGPDDVRRGAATLRLSPMATFTGRVLTADGDPIRGARVWADGGVAGVVNTYLHMMGDALSDKDGRFTLHVPTGCECGLGGSRDSFRGEYITLREPFTPTPGTTDLGDIRLVPKRRGEADEAPPKPATGPATPAASPSATRPATAPADGPAAAGREAAAAGLMARSDAATATTAPPATAPSAAAPPAVAPAVAAAAAAAADDEVPVRGYVLDPFGRPAAGATVTVAVNPEEGDPLLPRGPIVRATAGADGRFAVTFRKSRAAPAGLLTFGQSGADVWKSAVVVATAGDFGMAWARWDQTGPTGDIILILVPDHVVEGRLVDLEGRPVAGARVRPWFLHDRPLFLPAYYSRPKTYNTLIDPLAAAGKSDGADTDVDGRFRIASLGEERTTVLTVQSPSAVLVSSGQVVTRAMQPVTRQFGPRPQNLFTVHGTPATLTAAPARPVVGTVRDGKTHAPIAGATVSSPYDGPSGSLRAVTDGQGRFRIDGLPKGRKIWVGVSPPDRETAYFAEERQLADEPGLGPITVDVDLHPGVWLTGRVTDKASGQPVPSKLVYSPYRSNKAVAEHPVYKRRTAGDGEIPFNNGRLHTRADGTFRLAAIPGRGVLAAQAVGGRYVTGLGADALTELGSRWNLEGPATFDVIASKWSSILVEVDLPADRSAPPVDLRLERGGAVRLAVEDPAGNPVQGAHTDGLVPEGYSGTSTLEGATAEVVGLGPDERRAVLLIQESRRLGKVIVVGPDDVRQGSLTVRLEPLASVVGRLLDANGGPVAQARVSAGGRPASAGRYVAVPPTESGPDGRFTLLLPVGSDYAVGCYRSGKGDGNTSLAEQLGVAAGATKDLGDIRLPAMSGE